MGVLIAKIMINVFVGIQRKLKREKERDPSSLLISTMKDNINELSIEIQQFLQINPHEDVCSILLHFYQLLDYQQYDSLHLREQEVQLKFQYI